MLAKDGLTQVFENRSHQYKKPSAAEAAADGTYFALALDVFVP